MNELFPAEITPAKVPFQFGKKKFFHDGSLVSILDKLDLTVGKYESARDISDHNGKANNDKTTSNKNTGYPQLVLVVRELHFIYPVLDVNQNTVEVTLVIPEEHWDDTYDDMFAGGVSLDIPKFNELMTDIAKGSYWYKVGKVYHYNLIAWRQNEIRKSIIDNLNNDGSLVSILDKLETWFIPLNLLSIGYFPSVLPSMTLLSSKSLYHLST